MKSCAPERIGTKTRYVIVPEDEWLKRAGPRVPLRRWLVENMPQGYDLELPDRHEAGRLPFRTKEFAGSEGEK